MNHDDVWDITYRLTGDTSKATSDALPDDVLNSIDELREERDHLRSQLSAALTLVESTRVKWSGESFGQLRRDLVELQRVLALP